MGDGETPGQRHIAFVKAAVALAREHGMDNLTVSFRPNFRTSRGVGIYDGITTATWSEGRHGVSGRISLRFDGGFSFDEKDATHD